MMYTSWNSTLQQHIYIYIYIYIYDKNQDFSDKIITCRAVLDI